MSDKTESKLKDLHAAVCNGDVETVKQLVSGSNVNFCDSEKHLTLLAWAVTRNNVDVAEVIIANGGSLTVPDRDGFAPLHRAAWGGSIEIVELLLRNGADVNAVSSKHKKTPLALAAMRGDEALVTLLCRSGAQLNTRDARNMSALDHAALRGKAAAVAVLMDFGADCTSARELCDSGAETISSTVQQRDEYNSIAKMLSAVWAHQSAVTVV